MDPTGDMGVFVRVVAAGSLSRAAEDLGISTAMVSKRLARLEQRLGVRLLNRTTRRLHLTEQGALYHERCVRILAEIDDAEAQVSAGADSPRGTLRIAAPASFGRLHVAPFVAGFVARYPDIQVHLDLGERVIDLVEEGYDLAIRVTELRDSSLVARRLAVNQRYACASPAYLKRHGRPRAPGELRRHNCIVLADVGRRQDHWQLRGPEGPEEVRVSGTLETNNGEVIRQWALDGLGVVLKSTWDVGECLQRGELTALFPEETPGGVGIYALYPHRAFLPAKVRLFVEHLLDAYGPVPYWERGLDARGKRRGRR